MIYGALQRHIVYLLLLYLLEEIPSIWKVEKIGAAHGR